VDYIFDWARDIYREAIIQSLRNLAVNDSKSLTYDSDIFSIVDRVNVWSDASLENGELGLRIPEDMTIDAFRAFDNRYGAVRDARYIRSRFIALYVTEDNFPLLLESTKSQEASTSLAVTMLELLEEAWRVERKALDSLELCWTGQDRDGSDLFPPDKIFLVSASAASYLSPDWEQTRELSYVAIAETLLESLLKHAGRKRHSEQDFPFVEESPFSFAFSILQQHAARDNLLACLSRACVSTKILSPDTSRRKQMNKIRCIPSSERAGGHVKYRIDTAVVPDSNAKAREVVYSVYRQHKVGRCEPSSSLFRISDRLDEAILVDRPTEEGLQVLQETLWPEKSKIPYTDRHKVLFGIGEEVPGYPDLGLFVMDPSAAADMLLSEDAQEWPLSWHFQVRRFDHKLGPCRSWNTRNLVSQDVERLQSMVRSYIAYLRKPPRALDEGSSGPQATEQTWGPKKANRDLHFEFHTEMGARNPDGTIGYVELGGPRTWGGGGRPNHLLPHVRRQLWPKRGGQERRYRFSPSNDTHCIYDGADARPQILEDASPRGPTRNQNSLNEPLGTEPILSRSRKLEEAAAATPTNLAPVASSSPSFSKGFLHQTESTKSVVMEVDRQLELGGRKRPLILDDDLLMREDSAASTSPSTRVKRARIRSAEEFSTDFLDDTELTRLISKGFFS
jgi:hypothetical protein